VARNIITSDLILAEFSITTSAEECTKTSQAAKQLIKRKMPFVSSQIHNWLITIGYLEWPRPTGKAMRREKTSRSELREGCDRFSEEGLVLCVSVFNQAFSDSRDSRLRRHADDRESNSTPIINIVATVKRLARTNRRSTTMQVKTRAFFPIYVTRAHSERRALLG
jgi:hypothetical protein